MISVSCCHERKKKAEDERYHECINTTTCIASACSSRLEREIEKQTALYSVKSPLLNNKRHPSIVVIVMIIVIVRVIGYIVESNPFPN